MRRLGDRVGPDRLRDARGRAVEHGRVASGVTSRGAKPVPPVVSTTWARAGELPQRPAIAPRSSGTIRRSTSYPASGKQRRQHLAARILAHAGGDAVRDGEDGRPHSATSLVFSSSLTSSTTISLSMAFDHVVDGQRGDRGGRQRLHLDARLRRRLGRGHDRDARLLDLELDTEMRQRERVAERDQLGRPLRRHDPGELGGRQRVALRQVAQPRRGARAHAHEGARDRPASR